MIAYTVTSTDETDSNGNSYHSINEYMTYSFTVDETASTLTPANVVDALPPPTDGRKFKLIVTANLNGSTLA